MRLLLYVGLVLLVGVACTAASLLIASNTCTIYYAYGFPFLIFGSGCGMEDGVKVIDAGCESVWLRPWAIAANVGFYSGLVGAVMLGARSMLRRRASVG